MSLGARTLELGKRTIDHGRPQCNSRLFSDGGLYLGFPRKRLTMR